MSLTFGFYNSINGDRVYDAIQMGQIFDGIITDGIYATYLKAMVVKASDNASEVIVQPGRAWFNHTWTYIDADYPVEAPAPEVILDRVDTLVLDINAEYSDRENKIIWVQGTPASVNPEAPSLINTTTHHQYPLCNVYRKAGTTMIYAADITNRVGTSDTPFVTGVLTGINIDDLLSQWDDEFHTWEASTKTSFEAWMVNQQSVYVTWFESIRTQMEGDLTDFEAWFETIRGIIDEEAATHLQAEIDELKDMLPAGSHIDISTNESALFNRNVTVSDGVHSKTVQFNAVGGATVESFPYIGIISVTSTDGTRTAEESINIPYFGRYSVSLAFWAATVNLVGDESLAALPVTVRDSNGDVITVVTLNASGQGVFTATKPDIYKFTYTYGGQTMETTLQVTQETTYEVEIHGGFNYQAWLTAGRVSKTFTSLDDILADEKTLRQLFLAHDAVDYICNTFTTGSLEDVTKIFNTDLAAKWINNSDYALDHFGAVSDIKSIMDTADKYGYGELAIKGVGIGATSNSSDLGTVTTDMSYTASHGSWPTTITGQENAYLVFDGTKDAVGFTEYADDNTPRYIQFSFAESKTIYGAKVFFRTSTTASNFTVSYQNTNDEWVDLGTLADTISNGVVISKEFLANNPIVAKAIKITTKGGASTRRMVICEVEPLEYSPKGNVPIMTANNAPYGVVSASTTYNNGYEPWRAFDGSTIYYWASGDSDKNGAWLQYTFTNPVCVRKLSMKRGLNLSRCVKTFTLKASNDGTTWIDLGTYDNGFSNSGTGTTVFEYETKINNDNYYLIYRIVCLTGVDSTNYMGVHELQFYGRELKVSVPVMTSNTAPFGSCHASYELNGSTISRDSETTIYYLFNGVWDTAVNNRYKPATTGDGYTPIEINNFMYQFTKPVVITQAIVQFECDKSGQGEVTYKYQASNDNLNWVDLCEDIVKTGIATTPGTTVVTDFDNTTAYIYYRLRTSHCLLEKRGWAEGGLYELAFYGLDYSEKEFEAGTTKKWLYDHGVEPSNNLAFFKGQNSNQPIDDGNQIWMKCGSASTDGTSTYSAVFTNESIDLTPYSLLMSRIGNKYIAESNICGEESVWSSRPTYGGSYSDSARVASTGINLPITDNVCGVDISAVNQSLFVCVGSFYRSVRELSFTELWLE